MDIKIIKPSYKKVKPGAKKITRNIAPFPSNEKMGTFVINGVTFFPNGDVIKDGDFIAHV